jgi:hypothetical protein
MKRISLDLPWELHADVKIQAALEDTTISELVTRVVRQHVLAHKNKVVELKPRRRQEDDDAS